LTRLTATENEGQSVGFPMPQNLGDSAAPFQREAPTDGEASGRVEPMILPLDRVGIGPGTFSRSDLPPPIEAGASAEHGAPVLGEAVSAPANELDSQTGAAALSGAGDNVRAGESAPAEEAPPRDDWAFGARRFTRFLSGEKSADRGGEEGDRSEVLINASRKDFQNVTGEGHENGISSVGTDSAISAPTMTSSAFLPRLETATPAVLAASLPNGQTLEFGTAELNETNVPAEVAGTAQKAVTAVLERVESAAAREQHTVSLKFAMGETPLRVSVEWRADEVRTTFHTDSAELRAALAQEWQAVAAKSPERFDRFETPVFTSGSPGSSGQGSSASDGFARQSQAHSQSAGQDTAGYRPARGHLPPGTDGADATGSGSPDLAPLTSRHLHTHA
jgi:hypothetical protein